MTDRERDFEKIKGELMSRIAAGNAHAEELQRLNDRVSDMSLAGKCLLSPESNCAGRV